MSTTLPAYERPSLTRHRAGTMNKMGGIPALQPIGAIDGVPVEDLIKAYGSPLYVYSQRTIEDRYTELYDQLSRRWPRVQLAWSYKTNYLEAICKTLHNKGSWAEVVSEMELHKALRNGIPMNHIVYNGPHKTEASLEEALGGGALVNLDHFDELAMAERVADRLPNTPTVGLRLNLAAGLVPRWDRFGFDLDSGQARDAVRRLLGGGKLKLNGLHCHLGTFLLDADSYRKAAFKLVDFARWLRTEHGVVLDYIDLGGGFASSARLKSQYLPGEQVSPSLAQYAEAITDGLQQLDLPGKPPRLILETGRGMVDEAGSLVATVVANKRLADGRRAMVIDAGVNLLFTSFWYRHDVVPTKPQPGSLEPTVVYGNLCMNIDVVAENLMLPPLPVGSQVVIRTVGAYNLTQSMQFIHLRPAVAMVGRDGQHGVIRTAETLDDLCRGEELPAWMKDA